MQSENNWDDLRLVLAIADGHGLSGAAKLLGVHHATVLRRLNAMEHRTGAVFFDRKPTGYFPTATGEELAKSVRDIDETVATAYRKLAGQDLRLCGTIRIATSDFLASSLLRPILVAFNKRYPNIEIECVVSSQFASLTRRDADIAMRAIKTMPPNLVGTKVARLGYNLYAHKQSLTHGEGPFDAEAFDWVGDDHTIEHVATNTWRQQSFPAAKLKFRYDSMVGKFEAVKAGLGIGILPDFYVRQEPDLVRLTPDEDRWSLDLWLLTHPDLRRMNRIKAFMSCATEVLGQLNLR